MNLRVDNVTVSADCKKKFKIEDLLLLDGARKDIYFRGVMFYFPIPSQTDRNVSISVYESGMIVSMGSNDVGRAITCVNKLVKILGCSGIVPRVSMVSISGKLDDFTREEITNSMDKLKNEFNTSYHTDNEKPKSGVIMLKNMNNAYVEIYVMSDPISITCKASSEETGKKIIAKICEIIKSKNVEKNFALKQS